MNEHEVLIFDYLDKNITAQQQAEFDELMSTNVDFQELFEELQTMHKLMSTEELLTPSQGFEQRVMNSISQTKQNAIQYLDSTLTMALTSVCMVLLIIWSVDKSHLIDSISLTNGQSTNLLYASILVACFILVEFILNLRDNKLNQRTHFDS